MQRTEEAAEAEGSLEQGPAAGAPSGQLQELPREVQALVQALEERLGRLQAQGRAQEQRMALLRGERDNLRASLRDARAAAKQAAAEQKQLQRRLASAEKAAEGSRSKGEAAVAAAAAAQQQAARLAGELAEARAALEQRQEDARALGAAEREALTLRVAAMQVGASLGGAGPSEAVLWLRVLQPLETGGGSCAAWLSGSLPWWGEGVDWVAGWGAGAPGRAHAALPEHAGVAPHHHALQAEVEAAKEQLKRAEAGAAAEAQARAAAEAARQEAERAARKAELAASAAAALAESERQQRAEAQALRYG